MPERDRQPATHTAGGAMSSSPPKPEIYCVKCKTKTASDNAEAVTMKNGRPATRAICTVCGTQKFRIGAT